MQEIILPEPHDILLLHVCCAPCSGGILTRLIEAKIKFSIYFYNPNIYPVEEYNKRKSELAEFALKKGITVVDSDYDQDTWKTHIKGLENEPERGKRCVKCFDVRLEKTAKYASKNDISLFTTTLGISRWKNLNMVNNCGQRAALRYPKLQFWPYNWRKKGGIELMTEITKKEGFYKQQYCGCIHSYQWHMKKVKI